MIVLSAKLLRKYGTPDAAFPFVRSASKLFPRSAGVLKEFCVNRIAARDFGAVVARCAEVAADRKARDAVKDVASAYLTRASLEDEAPAETLVRLRNASRIQGAASLSHFEAGAYPEARAAFEESLRFAKIPSRSIPDWLGAFDAAAGVGSARTLPSTPPVDAAPVRKLVVSGMYWSGSGAIYDYLREFDQVSAVEGELRLWKEGDFCLDALSSHLGDQGAFRPNLFRFLTLALIGTGPVKNWREQMASSYALASSTSSRSAEYAGICRSFAEASAACVGGNVDAEPSFREAAARLSDELVLHWLGKRPEVALLDNVVHIGGIGAIGLLGDAVALCSFRDPRSNFVARWYENPRFDRDVSRYIDYYKDTIAKFEAAIIRSSDLAARVKRVSFEKFIVSEAYRDKLASDCGLDLGRRKKGRFFRPNASRKNVANYLDFPDQDAIKRIERELGVYCEEPSLP